LETCHTGLLRLASTLSSRGSPSGSSLCDCRSTACSCRSNIPEFGDVYTTPPTTQRTMYHSAPKVCEGTVACPLLFVYTAEDYPRDVDYQMAHVHYNLGGGSSGAFYFRAWRGFTVITVPRCLHVKLAPHSILKPLPRRQFLSSHALPNSNTSCAPTNCSCGGTSCPTSVFSTTTPHGNRHPGELDFELASQCLVRDAIFWTLPALAGTSFHTRRPVS